MENPASYCAVIHTINIGKRANLDINKGHHFIKAKSTGCGKFSGMVGG